MSSNGGVDLVQYSTAGDKTTVVNVGHVSTNLGSETEGRLHTLAVHNCSYTVAVKTKPCCGKTTTKTILKDINAMFKPGMNAILGPTGSGKSSLLDVLAGRKEPIGLTGTLLIDGAPPPDNFKCMVGYVVQDDVVMGTLTVRENFQFSAALRLPSGTSAEERKEKVESVIEELGLTKCADTKVGNEFIRGVSGGERKRTNIGMELIISPPVLFLDEPTTGLDASTANSVMGILRRMGLRGRTIIFSIHQPRFSIFKLFDSMVLLSDGEMVYNGPAPEALDYFKTLGYVCEEHNNPSDFFLDVINGDYATDTPEIMAKIANGKDESSQPKDNHLAEKFKQSSWHNNLMRDVNRVHDQYQQNVESNTVVRMPRVEYATSFLTQMKVLSGRAVKNLLRNPQSSILQIFVNIVVALLVGLIFFQLSETDLTTLAQDRPGAFFFIIMNQVFSNLGAIEVFIKERAIFMHENVSGFYRVSAFFLAKVFCDVIPMRLVPVLVFSSVAYWMIGLRHNAGSFFFFALTVFLTTLSSTGLAFAVSARVRLYGIANLMIAMVFILMMLFGGFLKNLAAMPDWLNWLKYFSIFRYGIQGLSINEFVDRKFCGSNHGNYTCMYGNTILLTQDISHGTTWDLWTPIVALIVMAFAFMTLAYVQLRLLKKLR